MLDFVAAGRMTMVRRSLARVAYGYFSKFSFSWLFTFKIKFNFFVFCSGLDLDGVVIDSYMSATLEMQRPDDFVYYAPTIVWDTNCKSYKLTMVEFHPGIPIIIHMIAFSKFRIKFEEFNWNDNQLFENNYQFHCFKIKVWIQNWELP